MTHRYNSMSTIKVKIFCTLSVIYITALSLDGLYIVQRINIKQIHDFFIDFGGISKKGETLGRRQRIQSESIGFQSESRILFQT